MSDAAQVDYDVRDGVAWVTLNRPDKLNALVGDMREVLLAHIGSAVADDAVRAVVITGAGRAFSAPPLQIAGLRPSIHWHGYRQYIVILQ